LTASERSEEVIPPLLVFGRGDLAVFDDVATAERYIEAIDVRNGEYDGVFDATGHPLVLEVGVQRLARWLPLSLERVRIRPQLDDAVDAGLASRIKDYLLACNVGEAILEGRSLGELVELARSHARTT
jgi:hypothetical protein